MARMSSRPLESERTESRTGPVVEVRDLVRTFGERRAIDGLSFEVRPGESVGLLGPNGAGKTTTIKVLSTVCAPTSGFVRVLGMDPTRDARSIRSRIGVVPQEVALYDSLSARENLAFFGRLYGIRGRELRERIERALEQAGLADRATARVGTYSGGMKRRLNIVAALMHAPELLFLDEPTVGLDPQSRNHVFELVERLIASGTALIYTTHQLGEVERLCQRIVILDHGRILAQGTLAELAQSVTRAGTRSLRVDAGPHVDGAAELLRARGVPFEVEEAAPSLEDVFLTLTGRALRDES
jgi:ABC-2 type transport system ATP-binding protein